MDPANIGPYEVLQVLHEDSYHTAYHVHKDGEHFVAKISKGNSLLLGREMMSLASLSKECEAKLIPYMPEVVGPVVHDGSIGSVFAKPPERFYSLTQVRDRYPDGIDPRDMAWMYRRLLAGLHWAHMVGFIHGAIVPDNVWIQPELHGLVIDNWFFSNRSEDSDDDDPLVEFIDWHKDYKAWYPPEIHDPPEDRPYLSEGVDTYMAALCAIYLIGGDPDERVLPDGIAREYRVFFNGCLQGAEIQRPAANKTLSYLDNLLDRLYGGRRFREFCMD